MVVGKATFKQTYENALGDIINTKGPSPWFDHVKTSFDVIHENYDELFTRCEVKPEDIKEFHAFLVELAYRIANEAKYKCEGCQFMDRCRANGNYAVQVYDKLHEKQNINGSH